MALTEDRGGHGHGFADGGLRRQATEVDDGGNVHHGYASNHGPHTSDSGVVAQPGARSGHPPGRGAPSHLLETTILLTLLRDGENALRSVGRNRTRTVCRPRTSALLT